MKRDKDSRKEIIEHIDTKKHLFRNNFTTMSWR
jgi:hypothetical protein